MKKALAIVFSAACAFACALRLAASPAATVNWVVRYVATNDVQNVHVLTNIATGVELNSASPQVSFMFILQTGGTNAVAEAVEAVKTEVAPIVDAILGNTMIGL